MVNIIPNVWKSVYKEKKYWTITIGTALIFFLINVVIANFKSLIQFSENIGILRTIKLFVTISISFYETIKLHSYISLIIVSILLGILLTLIIYKINLGKINPDKKTGFFATIGIALAALAPGCAVCGVGLLSILGVSSGFLTILPYNGLELSIASILILTYAIRKVTIEMYMCKADLKIKE
ncbi:hypothetical protein HN604_02285 [archaeon]|jgi:hypothetical protein|nr:hypothetical protein [archaeon]MBT6183064.1 hypothetical protein [archaeon]MBT6606244.1 hypothetical protein [archaeon]MBT7251587.1 hypothetical protein [archaeon]MBT7660890.1 hypothetical protein [archaeon]